MRNVLGRLSVAGAFIFILGCGKDNTVEPAKVEPPRGVLLGNATLAKELQAKLPAAKQIYPAQNCFQVMQTSDKKIYVEHSGNACPNTLSLLPQSERRLEAVSDVASTEDGLVPKGAAYLFAGDLPVGQLQLVSQKPAQFEIQDLCTLDPYYVASCTLEVENGVLKSVTVSKIASLDRLKRERGQTRELASLLAQKQKIAKQADDLRTVLKSNETFGAEQKRFLTSFIAGQERGLKLLEDDLRMRLNSQGGFVKGKGLKDTFAEAATRVRELQPAYAALVALIDENDKKQVLLQKNVEATSAALKKAGDEVDGAISVWGQTDGLRLIERLVLQEKIQIAKDAAEKAQKASDTAKAELAVVVKMLFEARAKKAPLETEFVKAKMLADRTDKPLKNAMSSLATAGVIRANYAMAKDNFEKDKFALGVKELESAEMAYLKLVRDLNELAK